MREGDRGDWLYIIADGEVEVVRRVEDGHQILGCLGRGECFGEIAMISDTPRTATVRSKTGVNVLAVDRDAFHTLFASLPPLRGFFEQLIEERVGGAPTPGADR